MINVKIGNIFESNMAVLVNTINCVGVMGKGIAKSFKEKYPPMFYEYQKLCTNNSVKPGILYPYYENNRLIVLNFPTKDHWRSPSKLEYIVDGLNWFIENYKQLNITSIAFPPLGCGNGGLDWDIVGPIMYQKLIDLPINIEIYAPYGTPINKTTPTFLSQSMNLNNDIKGIKYKNVNDNWLLVLKLVKELENSKYSVKVGRTIFQKICYVLERHGTNLDLSYHKGTYGPYSPDIKEMITILSNNNLIYEKKYGNMLLVSVTDNFTFDSSIYSKKDKDNTNKTFSLFRRIKDTEHAELITTVLYSYDALKQSNQEIHEEDVFDYIIKWKKRYNNLENEIRIHEIIEYLSSQQLITVIPLKNNKYDDLF